RRARARRWSIRRGRRGGAPSPLCLAGVVDAERRLRVRLETLDADRLAAGGAGAVRPVVDALQRRVDLGEDLLGVLPERVVDLPVQRRRRRLAEVAVGDR